MSKKMKKTDEEILEFLGIKEGDIVFCEIFKINNEPSVFEVKRCPLFNTFRLFEYEPNNKTSNPLNAFSLMFLIDHEYEILNEEEVTLKMKRLIKHLMISEAKQNITKPTLKSIESIIEILSQTTPEDKQNETTLQEAFENYYKKKYPQISRDIKDLFQEKLDLPYDDIS